MQTKNSSRLSLTWKLHILFVFLFALFCGLGFFSINLLSQLEAVTTHLHNEVTGFSKLDNITRFMTEERYLLANLIISESTADLIKTDKLLVKNREEFAQASIEYEKTIFSAESNHLFIMFESLVEDFQRESDVAFELAVQNKEQEALKHIQKKADPAFYAAMNSLIQLRKTNEKIARSAFTNSSKVYNQGKMVLVIAIIMVSIGTILITRYLRLEIITPILNLTKAITRLALWELNIEIPEQQRNDELGCMANSIKSLQQTAHERQQHTWIKTRLQDITQEVQKAENIEEFAKLFLHKLSAVINAKAAVFYYYDTQNEAFSLTSQYGLTPRPGHPTLFRRREGMLGQCADNKVVTVIEDLPPDYLAITSGLVNGVPRQLIIAPLMTSSEEVLAVMEFALIDKIDENCNQLLKELLPIIGLSLQVLERSQRTKDLLQQSKQQTEELARQSERILSDQQKIQKQHDSLLQTNDELATKTRELEATLEKLEEATRVKNVFLANMSHEIRTPMNAVIGMSHLCLKTALTEKQKDYIEKIQKAGFSLLEIINNILDFSKLEDNNMKVRSSLFNVNELIEHATAEFAIKAKNKGLAFTTEVVDMLPPNLYGDQARIRQILQQLLANAVKFTETGEIKLTIKTPERKNDQIKICFEVHDTGIGMSQEQIAMMFQPFRQLDESSTRQFSGTGIGLALCKRLAEMLGGQILIKSETGQGSIFSFELWCDLVTESLVLPTTISFDNMRTLVVDDNPIDQQILREQLTETGIRVETCENGPEAIMMLRQAPLTDPFKVVFIDWRLPGMDGIEIIRQIEGLPNDAGKPLIILITAYEIEEVRDQAELAGVKAFLPKPVTPSSLWTALSKAFGTPWSTTGSDSGQKNLRGMRILLVEDNELNQQIARELLQSVGILVTLADNGKTALDLVKSAPDPLPFDAILMDIQMPVMDGHQATIELRKDERFKKLPIIALTAHAMEEEKQLCLEEGMNGHIAKPIEPQILFSTLAQWAKKKPGPASEQNQILDSKAGLRRVAANRKLYDTLLKRFCSGQAGAISSIRKTLAEGNVETAIRTAHTLKGIAGNIGAIYLQKLAAAVEDSIKKGGTNDEIAVILNECEEVFNKTMAEIGKYTDASQEDNMKKIDEPKPEPGQPAPEKVDSSSAARIIRRFHYLLSQSDGEAEDFLELNELYLSNLLGKNTISKLHEALSRFEFDEALSHLNASANEKKIKI